jgi:hypothetical protein
MNSGMVAIINDECLVIRLSGIFDSGALQNLARELNTIEAVWQYKKRFVFVDDNLTVAITSDDIMLFKNLRQEQKTLVQSAFCAANDFQYGFARMFQMLLEGEKHAIEIFRDRGSAAKWLKVDPALLESQQPPA